MNRDEILHLVNAIKAMPPPDRRDVAAAIYPEGFPERVTREAALQECYAQAKRANDHEAMAKLAGQL